MEYTQQPYQTMPGAGVPGMPGAPMPGPTPAPEEKGKKGKKGKDGKAPTKKVVNRQFVIAAVFALVAAGGVYAAVEGTAPQGKWVAVAKGPIPTNTEVDANLLTAVQVSDKLLQPGSVTGATADDAVAKAAAALKDVRSQYPITQNAQIIPDQFGIVVNLGTPLAPDERLVSFRASVGASVAGSVKPGDHVDMYASAGEVAGPIVYNVPVVSVTVSEDRYNSVADQQAGDKNARPQDLLPGDPVPGTYVVRVKASEVGKIVAADGTGKIYLVYRGQDATDSAVDPTTAKDAICESGAGLAACR